MNGLRAVLFLSSVSSLAIASQAQAPPSQNIVTVSFNAAVIQTAEAQRELGALETRFAPRQAQLKALNDEVDALRKQISNTNDKLTDTERATREQTLDKKRSSSSARPKILGTIRRVNRNRCFRRLRRSFTPSCRRTHSSTATQPLSSAVPTLPRSSGTLPVIWTSQISWSRPTTRKPPPPRLDLRQSLRKICPRLRPPIHRRTVFDSGHRRPTPNTCRV